MSWPENMWVSVTTLWGSGKSWVNLHRTGVRVGMALQVWKLEMVRMVGYTQKSWAHCHYKYKAKIVSSPWKVIIPKGGCRFTSTTFSEGWFCWLLGVYIMGVYNDDQIYPITNPWYGRYHLPAFITLKNQPHLGKYFSSMDSMGMEYLDVPGS